MALTNLTADDYGLLGNAASQPDGRVRYGETLDPAGVDHVKKRIKQVRCRLVEATPPLMIEHRGADPEYPDFEITEAGRQLLLERTSGPAD